MALRALASPPSDITQRLFLRIKVHPKRPELELFAAVGGQLSQKVLPINCELRSALHETDLVVAVNYYGSALVHALRSGKPVILFYTDSLIGETGRTESAKLFFPAGTLVKNATDFWSLVREFFTHPDLAERMRLKTQDFCRENLDDSNYPSIGEVLDSILSEHPKPCLTGDGGSG
jgi:hypothetical protein